MHRKRYWWLVPLSRLEMCVICLVHHGIVKGEIVNIVCHKLYSYAKVLKKRSSSLLLLMKMGK